MEFTIIKNHPQYEISKEGIVRKIANGAIKSQYLNDKGYYMISIRYGLKSKPYRVSRLVAETFIPNHKNKPEVNHINGIKTDNSWTNLEWVTHKENIEHAIKMGLINNKGSNNGMAILTEKDIPEIRRLLNTGLSQYKIAKMFKVSRSAILNIKVNGYWPS